MKLKGIEAALFDLFDTLLLIERGDEDITEKCMKNVYAFLSRNGIDVSYETFRKSYSEARKQIYERTGAELEEPHFTIRVSKALRNLGYNYDEKSRLAKGAADAYIEELSRYVHPDENAIPVLKKLREHGYKIGVVSNFSIPEGARWLIAKHGLEKLLDTIIISGEINRRKPSPEIFFKALSNLRVDATRAVFIGDTPDTDIEGAKKVGMKTILIKRGDTNLENTKSKPDFTIRNLKEILEILL